MCVVSEPRHRGGCRQARNSAAKQSRSEMTSASLATCPGGQTRLLDSSESTRAEPNCDVRQMTPIRTNGSSWPMSIRWGLWLRLRIPAADRPDRPVPGGCLRCPCRPLLVLTKVDLGDPAELLAAYRDLDVEDSCRHPRWQPRRAHCAPARSGIGFRWALGGREVHLG